MTECGCRVGRLVLKASTGRGVVLAKKQFSPTVSFSASAREFSSDFFPIIKHHLVPEGIHESKVVQPFLFTEHHSGSENGRVALNTTITELVTSCIF
jgi:hypothetical protein